MSAKIKEAVQEILEIARRHDLAIHFVLAGREAAEVRMRFPTWSCFEQTPDSLGVHFRTRVNGTGDRRPKKDIEDSISIARTLAETLTAAALPAIQLYDGLKEKIEFDTDDRYLGGPPPWDKR